MKNDKYRVLQLVIKRKRAPWLEAHLLDEHSAMVAPYIKEVIQSSRYVRQGP